MGGASPTPTAIHRIVDRCRAGDHPALVIKLASGWVVMGDPQVFTGYCLLLPDPVVEHLNALDRAASTQFLADMAAVGDAVLVCTGAVRINYAMFGNAEPALHAHVIPRQSDEPAAIRNTHPWALDWNQAPRYSAQAHGALQERIARHLRARLGAARGGAA